MLKSGLFRRTISLVLFTIFLSAVLTVTIFIPIARREFASMRAAELEPKARYIADVSIKYLWNPSALNFANLQSAIGTNTVWGAQVLIFNGRGELALFTHSMSEDSTEAKAKAEAFASTLSNYVVGILATGDATTIIDNSTYETGYLLVGVPVSNSGITVGVVFISKPMVEVNTSLDGLNLALVLSMIAVFIIMMVPCFAMARILIKPINQMRDVSMAMASGNFSIRATANARSEIGQLGGSLNYLSEQLSRSIGALTVERNRLGSILNGLSEGIIAVDRMGSITHVNPAISAIFGHSGNSISDRTELISDASLWDDFDSVVTDGSPVVRSLVYKKQIYKVNITPLEDDSHNTVGAVGVFHDVTESERLEQTRREYVANVSHELRTPVAAVRGFAEALSDGMVKDEESRRRFLGHICHESMRLSRLIDDLLELSRLQTGAVAFEKARFSPYELLLSFADCYRAKASELGVELNAIVSEDCPDVYNNEDRVDQVLVVLFDNALKFTDDGGRITLSAREDADSVVISVSDTGCGINADDLPHVFDRFFKSDRAHSGSGTGLGLSIAKEIMNIMGEKIWVESVEGKGATFSFTLHKFAAKGTEES